MMKKARILALSLILLMILASKFFPDFLVLALLKEPYLPMGTLVAWLAIISIAILPWLASSGVRQGQTLYFLVLKYLTFLATGSALLWPFVGRLLAGNWHFSFSNAAVEFIGSPEAGFLYWRFTGLVVMLPLLVFILIWGQYLVRKL